MMSKPKQQNYFELQAPRLFLWNQEKPEMCKTKKQWKPLIKVLLIVGIKQREKIKEVQENTSNTKEAVAAWPDWNVSLGLYLLNDLESYAMVHGGYKQE